MTKQALIIANLLVTSVLLQVFLWTCRQNLTGPTAQRETILQLGNCHYSFDDKKHEVANWAPYLKSGKLGPSLSGAQFAVSPANQAPANWAPANRAPAIFGAENWAPANSPLKN